MPDSNKERSPRNPKWQEKELILALDLYMELPRNAISARNIRVVKLSDTLNRLKAAEQVDQERFRNPNGVALKLHNFSRFDPQRQGSGMSHGGKLEKIVWNTFAGDRGALKEEAQRIRESIGEMLP